MNRVVSLHPLSLVLGLVFGVLVLLSMSQLPPPNARTFNVQYGPDPRDMLQIHEGAPYVVPQGKLFVLTAIGSLYWGTSGGAVLSVDGQPELSGGMLLAGGWNGTSVAEASSIAKTPIGFTVAAGSTITVGGGGTGRAWGYLAPQ